MNPLKKSIEIAKDILFPRRCPFCDSLLSFGERGVCESCRPKLPYIRDDFCLRCGKPLLPPAGEYCPVCASNARSFDMGRSLFVYNDMVRHSIASFKYKNKREYAEYYGEELCRHFGRLIRTLRPDAIVAVPVSSKKLKKRGYNQAELIAARMSRLTGIPLRDDCIIRIRDTAPQKDLSRSMRQKNLKKAFKITGNVVKLKTIIVIDDIYTTGATVSEISSAFKDAGVKKVCFLTLASGSAI